MVKLLERKSVYNMKQLIAIFSLALLVMSCKQTNKAFLISNESIGQFKQGITLTDVEQLVPKKQLKRVIQEGEFQDEKHQVYQYFDKNNTHLLDFLLVDDEDSVHSKIERIVVVSSLYKTKAVWGVGSTFEEVRKSTEILQTVPDMEVIHIQIENPKLWLMIDKLDLKEAWWNEDTKSINIDKIPNGARVKGVYKSMN